VASRLEVCREIPLETSSGISRREIYVTRYRTNKIPAHFVWAGARARVCVCACACACACVHNAKTHQCNTHIYKTSQMHVLVRGGEDPLDAISVYVIFCKRAL